MNAPKKPMSAAVPFAALALIVLVAAGAYIAALSHESAHIEQVLTHGETTTAEPVGIERQSSGYKGRNPEWAVEYRYVVDGETHQVPGMKRWRSEAGAETFLARRAGDAFEARYMGDEPSRGVVDDRGWGIEVPERLR